MLHNTHMIITLNFKQKKASSLRTRKNQFSMM